jgi:hypothetical protein
MGKNRVFTDRVANLVDFSPIKANLGSLLKNVFGIFNTNIWISKYFKMIFFVFALLFVEQVAPAWF